MPERATSTPSERHWLLDTLAALVAAGLLAVAGWHLAALELRGAAAVLGLHRLVLTSRWEVGEVAISIAVSWALPVVLAWVVAMLDRAFGKAAPSVNRAALYTLALAAVASISLVLRVWWMNLAISAVPDPGLEPMITASSLELGWAPIRWTIAASIPLAIAAVVLARRRGREA